MRPLHITMIGVAALSTTTALIVGGVLGGHKHQGEKEAVAKPRNAPHRAVTQPKRATLPPLTPDYAVTLQAILDAARPKGEGRITVHDCRSGRYGNEHFCTWSTPRYACEAGFIQEQPGQGTVPVQTGRVPGYTRATCRSGPILAKWFAEAGA